MALNGDIGNWVHNGRYPGYGIFISWTATPNNAGNYSDVTVSVSMRSIRGDTWFKGYDTDIWIEINGNGDHRVLGGFSLGGNETKYYIYSLTIRVPHDPDGNKSFSYSASISNSIVGTLSARGSGSLTKIPRAYDFITSSPTTVMDTNFTVKVLDNGSGFTARLYTAFGNKRLLIHGTTPVGTDYNFQFQSKDWADQIPNQTYGDGTIIIETWNGGTKIGETKKPIRMTIPDNINPSISGATYSDQNNAITAITGSNQILVNGYSIPRMSVDAHGIYGSTIVEYKFEIRDTTITNIGYLTDISLQTYDFGAGMIPVKVTVKDGRGRTDTTTINLNILAYSAPSLLNFSALRIAAEDGTMTTIQVKKSVSVSSIKNGTTEKNTYTVKTEIKKTSDTAWQTVKLETNTSSNFNLTGYSILDSYDIRITVADTISASTPAVIRDIIPTDNVLMDKYRNEALGVGKYAEPGKGVLQVGGMIWMNNQSLMNFCHPVGSSITTTDSRNPSTYLIGGTETTWVQDMQGYVAVGVNPNDSDFDTVGKTGGEKTHTLTEAELPKLSGSQLFHGASGIGTNLSGATGIIQDWSKIDNKFHSNASSEGAPSYGAFNINFGGDKAHNNLQPYKTKYIWTRTA